VKKIKDSVGVIEAYMGVKKRSHSILIKRYPTLRVKISVGPRRK